MTTRARKRRKTDVPVSLTKRHREVIRLLSLGCTVNEAAAILKLSPSTVDNHKTAAMKRLGTDKLALLTRLAIKLRISALGDRLTPTEKRLSGRKNDGWN
ncbi:MAG: LuxR C-terminal-related transcriptional regulator [Thermoguttaceae bacterium]|jgi:DNA-binding NarL/FixJ family response regulator|nr:LuxR C-terminal-related transcriptional regulator [Thermoguttaceae bacterium]